MNLFVLGAAITGGLPPSVLMTASAPSIAKHSISRADVASFLVAAATEGAYDGRGVIVTGA